MPLSSRLDATSRLRRLKYDLAAERVLAAARRVIAEFTRFDPEQPRVPAGQPGGGRWTSGKPGSSSFLTDPTGEASWSDIVSLFGEDGSLVSQFISNRDGTGIFTEFGDATTAWDERNTVVTNDGATIRFETTGDAQSITDVRSGELLSRSTWTDAGPVSDPTIQPALLQAYAVEKTIEAAAVLWTFMSGRNTDNSTAVMSFRADAYQAGAGPNDPAVYVGTLTRDDVEAACPRYTEVQSMTDAAAQAVRSEGRPLSSQQFGTAVHSNLKWQIDSLYDPNLRAEVSFLKTSSEPANYGAPGSVRIDVLENTNRGTVCVYDIKTGRSVLALLRSAEIARAVNTNFGPGNKIILSEIRPR